MTICIAGKNDIAVESLRFALATVRDARIVALPCKSDEGVDTWQKSLRKHAEEAHVEILPLESLYAIAGVCFFSLEYDRLIDVARFSTAKLFNIHFSLLPAYKGAYTSIWPILNDEKQSGVTLHVIDHGIDTGPIIDQKVINIGACDTSRMLYENYLLQGTKLLQENFSSLVKGEYRATAQQSVGSSFYSRASIDFKNITVDLKRTAHQICNQVRAFYFPEYQVPKICGIEVKSAEILQERSVARPGTIIGDTVEHFDVATIDFNIRCFRKGARS